MISPRHVLAALVLLSAPSLALSIDAGARFESLVARYYSEDVASDPTLRTESTLTPSEGSWTPVSDAWRAQRERLSRQRLEQLSSIDRGRLPAAQRLRFDILKSTLESNLLEARVALNSYGDNNTNIYENLWRLPDLMIRNQKVLSEADALNYISRLRGLAPVLSDMLAAGARRHERGIVMMKPLYGQLAAQARAYSSGEPCSPGDPNPLAADFRRKLAASQVPEDRRAGLSAAVDTALVKVLCPAYSQAAQRILALAPRGREQGLWSLPHGRETYRDSIELALDERVDPDRLFELGTREVARLRREISELAKRLGIAPDAASINTYLTSTPALSVANSDAGYAQFQASAAGYIAFIKQRLPEFFSHVPTTPLVVKRAVKSLSGGPPSPGSYYTPALADGSKPAVYWLAFPPGPERYSLASLPALSFHEGLPGHHLQFSTSLELAADMKDLRARQYTCYVEGWALYAEQLAYEMGGYQADPHFILGWRLMQLERAARLVLDTGLNDRGWSPERAEAYQVSVLGGAPNISRFLEMPGQALGYTWGFLEIMSLRERARAQLGDRFDIKAFHAALLDKGELPPRVMVRRIDELIAAQRSRRP